MGSNSPLFGGPLFLEEGYVFFFYYSVQLELFSIVMGSYSHCNTIKIPMIGDGVPIIIKRSHKHNIHNILLLYVKLSTLLQNHTRFDTHMKQITRIRAILIFHGISPP